MNKLAEAQKRQTAGQAATGGVNRVGIVTSFDPNTFTARVDLQPAGLDVGWCAVLSAWVGAGWGLTAPLQPGDQVLLAAMGASGAVNVIIGRFYSDVDQPPLGAAAGELWLRHETGATVALKADGTIDLTASAGVVINGPLTLNGNFTSTGTMTNNGHAVGSTHEHGGVSTGTSNTGPVV